MKPMQYMPRLSTFALCVLLTAGLHAQQHYKPDKTLARAIRQHFVAAANQYKVLMKELPPGRFPQTYHSIAGKLTTSRSGWWCSGFYPGTLLYLYEQTKDSSLYREAIRV